MTILPGETHYLGFDAGAISRPYAGDLARIKWCPIQIGSDNIVAARIGPTDPALHLLLGYSGPNKRKRCGRFVAWLSFKRIEIYALSVKSWRRAGLEPAKVKADMFERLA